MSSLSTLHDLLLSYANIDDAARSRIERAIWERHGIRGAVLVLDMAGFSETAERRGIVYYLALVRRMQVLVEPIIGRHGGTVVKFAAAFAGLGAQLALSER